MKFFLVISILVIFILILVGDTLAYANSAALVKSDNSQVIVFENHENSINIDKLCYTDYRESFNREGEII